MKTITVRSEGLVLDAILSREFGAVVGRSLVAETLALNAGLSSLGLILPLNTVITLPDAPPVTAYNRPVVSLFG